MLVWSDVYIKCADNEAPSTITPLLGGGVV